MNKIFNKFLIGVLFFLGIILIPAFKADATIPVTVTANGVSGSKTVNYGEQVTIAWISSGASACTNNFGGSATTSGIYTYTATTTQTFTVNCTSSTSYPQDDCGPCCDRRGNPNNQCIRNYIGECSSNQGICEQ